MVLHHSHSQNHSHQDILAISHRLSCAKYENRSNKTINNNNNSIKNKTRSAYQTIWKEKTNQKTYCSRSPLVCTRPDASHFECNFNAFFSLRTSFIVDLLTIPQWLQLQSANYPWTEQCNLKIIFAHTTTNGQISLQCTNQMSRISCATMNETICSKYGFLACTMQNGYCSFHDRWKLTIVILTNINRLDQGWNHLFHCVCFLL